MVKRCIVMVNMKMRLVQRERVSMKSLFEKMIGVNVARDYALDDDGIVHVGARGDITAYADGDFGGKCVTFLRGNGEIVVDSANCFAGVALA